VRRESGEKRINAEDGRKSRVARVRPGAYIATQSHYMERRSQVEELASGAGWVVVCVEWKPDIERSTRRRTSGERAAAIRRQARKR
jgi:hypothetical protein